MHKLLATLPALFGLTLLPTLCLAAETADTGDTAWMLISTALVLIMLPGLALFYAGMVRSKNVLSTTMHTFAAMAIIGVQWVVVGYTLAFGGAGPFIGSLENLFLNGIGPDSLSGTIPTYVFVMFQGMFAIITPALISGAIAERMKFSTYCVFILLWSVLVYDPLAHWVWGEGGWLLEMGALDFAGGTVVHLSSGISALVLCLFLGKRKGFPHERMAPHNLPMTLLGAGLLWFGWFGFNAGSALSAGGGAALAFTTTQTAAAAAALSWMLLEWLLAGKPSALGVASGIVAGLVTITPAAGFVTPGWAIVMGLLGGAVCYGGVMLKHKLGYDDSLDVLGIHGIGGAFGALATGVFATVGATSVLTGDFHQLWVQFVGIAAAAAYAVGITTVLLLILKATMGLRVEHEDEIIGLDQTAHSETGYNL
ncbi:ammonia channel protein [Syntrophotalea acetylenivorans]|uniref:Ammonium transporter n=1 Tax=Syntrophotalea acetylenivorans TaxID=1842532 RepID=A0A1L3GPE8_9BACT|nr:ammonium transporter [Syntrophotalea acetylenivorans]APG27802.1 ammonia channel protein [Syntrophotalea acetylenivorans]